MRPRISPDVRQRVLDLFDEGLSRDAIARAVGISGSSVTNIARAEGRKFNPLVAKIAIQAARDYNQMARIEIANRAFARLGELLDGQPTARDLQALAIAFGILTDKRRLEDGEATERAEHVDLDAQRERISAWLDRVAARRRAEQPAERSAGD